METMYAEIEYWDERTGREILLAALMAAGPLVVAESVHVYDPTVLTARGCDEGEVSLWFSIGLTPGCTTHDFFTTVRNAQIRVKEAGPVPAEFARCSSDEFWGWMRSEYERMEAEWEAEG